MSWYTSAFTAWFHHTWHHTANQHHSALVGPICDTPRLANSTFLARRLTMGKRSFAVNEPVIIILEQLTY